nr:regucalcin-like isoform X1 [Leptinotarsa decemlineata]
MPNKQSAERIFTLFLLFFIFENNGQHFSKKEMAPKVERIEAVEPTELGEGPHWDEETQSLYFVDIFGKSIHKYVPSTNKHTSAVIDGDAVSLIIPVKGEKDKFLISIGRELAIVTWNGESEKVSETKKIYEVDDRPEISDNRFNDGKCDPSGRLWAGTMGGEPVNGQVKLEKGSLFSFRNNKITTHLTKIGISNGLAWNENLKKMYYIDTIAGSVNEYDFDIENGTIANGKPIFTLAKNGIVGGADGMAIDTDGNLWVAVFNGYRVIKIDPRKADTLLDSIQIPSKQVTSVAFGGPNLDELYVTSAKFTIDGEELPPPEHGGTYRVTGINAKGYPGVRVVL